MPVLESGGTHSTPVPVIAIVKSPLVASLVTAAGAKVSVTGAAGVSLERPTLRIHAKHGICHVGWVRTGARSVRVHTVYPASFISGSPKFVRPATA